MDQVATLIQQLYDPSSSPETIQEAQHQLLVAQKSPQGWELADFLLDQNDPQAQFMGALTYSIKINDDKFELPNNIRHQLLSKLQQALAKNYQQFVVLKLFSTIHTLFVRTYSDWDSFMVDIHHILGSHLPLELTFFEELMHVYVQGYTGAHQLRSYLETMTGSIGELVDAGLNVDPEKALALFYQWCLVFASTFEPLLPRVVSMLRAPDEQVFEKTCNVLADLYGDNARSWPKHQRNTIIGSVVNCTEPFDWDRSIPVGRLALAICSNDIITKDVNASSLLPYILRLTNSPSVEDDELLTEVLEFWNQFADDVVSNGMSSDYNSIFMDVVQTYWRRIQVNGKPTASEWEKVRTFRRDFCDLLELVYPLLGRSLFDTFASTILTNISSGDPHNYKWAEIEASLCCLNGLADIIDDRGDEYKAIEAVFSSRLWTDLSTCPTLRVRHTAVSVIGSYDTFFERPEGRANLATALTYLFESLTIASLQLTASRSIQKLCSSCREALTSECYNFLQAYEPLRFKLDNVAHQRTVSAITYVIQALPLEEQAEPLWRLMMMVENSELQPIDLVKNLASIAKAVKKPGENFTPQEQAKAAEFWGKDPKGIRENLLMVINELFGMPSDVFEELCQIFKAGLSEHVPTPFTFDSGATIEFMHAKRQQARRDDIPIILNLAGFLISVKAASKELSPELILKCLELVSAEAMSQSIELLATALSKAPDVFVQLPNFEGYLQLAMTGLVSNDRFILIQSSKFWTTLVSEPQCKDTVNTIGGELMDKLALQISGEAERSEVQYFSDILRKLISKHMRLSGQLLKKSFIDDPKSRNLRKQDENTRSTFVSQLQLLRGSSQTKDVVNKFWLFCRGLPEY